MKKDKPFEIIDFPQKKFMGRQGLYKLYKSDGKHETVSATTVREALDKSSGGEVLKVERTTLSSIRVLGAKDFMQEDGADEAQQEEAVQEVATPMAESIVEAETQQPET